MKKVVNIAKVKGKTLCTIITATEEGTMTERFKLTDEQLDRIVAIIKEGE